MNTLQEGFDWLSVQIEKVAHQTLMDAGQLGEETARNTKLFHNNGPLREATNFHSTDRLSGFVLADKDYAHLLEDGNPYEGFEIKPIRAKVLHFWSNGEEHFVSSVKAHGPLPFMGDAERKVEEEIEGIFNNNWRKIMGV